MTVFVLIREDQNHYGFIDTSITGIFHDERTARETESFESQRAREEGLIVEDDESADANWQVSWSVEAYIVS